MAVCSAERCHWDKQARSICHVEITRRLQGDYREITRRLLGDATGTSRRAASAMWRVARGAGEVIMGSFRHSRIDIYMHTAIARCMPLYIRTAGTSYTAGGCAASKTPKDPLAMLDL